jgi:anti-sigma-K factor RskA
MNGQAIDIDLDALIDAQLTGRERERLRRAHDTLLRAGPLPELPASLRQPPAVAVRRLRVPPPARPRRHLPVAAAATLALAAAGAGYFVTTKPAETVQRAVAMHATAQAPRARAMLRIGTRDRAGNWPVTLRVRGLPALPAGSYYEMYLTNKGHLVAGCGAFKTDGGTTVIHFNVPYQLGEYSGWTITRQRPQQPPNAPLLTT